jgi:polyisoprenoid-binding protein YceI
LTATFDPDPAKLPTLKAEADLDATSVATREADRDTAS